MKREIKTLSTFNAQILLEALHQQGLLDKAHGSIEGVALHGREVHIGQELGPATITPLEPPCREAQPIPAPRSAEELFGDSEPRP